MKAGDGGVLESLIQLEHLQNLVREFNSGLGYYGRSFSSFRATWRACGLFKVNSN